MNLFEITKLYDHIYIWFDILKTKKAFVNGFVIMPNHLHLILFISKDSEFVNKILGTGKRFMAYEIVKRLKKDNRSEILHKLKMSVKPFERKRRKLHQVFEPSFDIKELTTLKFVIQKLNYLHRNPVSDKWNLCEDYRLYKHSSAGFYELNYYDGYKIVHYDEAFEESESSARDSD